MSTRMAGQRLEMVRTALAELASYLRLMGDIDDTLLTQDLRDVQRLARAFLASLKERPALARKK